MTQNSERENISFSQDRYRMFSEAGFEGIAFSVGGIIVDANEQLARLHGYELHEIIGEPVSKLLAPSYQRVVQDALLSGYEGTDEVVAQRKDGTTIVVEAAVRSVVHQGRTMQVAVIRDITAHKRTEDALRESEERFRTLANNISQLAWMADGTGHIFWYNERWFDYTGTTLDGMEGWGWQKVHHLDHVDRVVKKYREAVLSGVSWEDTFPLRGRDGQYRWFLSRAIPVKDSSGKVVRWFGTNTDVTSERENAEALRRRVEELETLMDLVPVAIWVAHDPGCHIITGNRTANEYYEARARENVSAGPAQGEVSRQRLFSRDGRLLQPEELPMQRAAAQNVEVRNEVLDVLLPSGRWLNMLGSASPLRDAEGNVRGCLGAFVDITERRRYEEALRASEENLKELVDRLARSNRELQQFAYVASHDLQEPLRQVIAFVQLLEDQYGGELDAQAREYMDFVVEGARRMHELIVDLLTYARVESEQNLTSVAVDQAVDQALFNLDLAVRESKAVITRETLPIVHGEKSQLVQVFQNLLSNAIKFKADKPPVIHIGVAEQEGEYLFSVSDNGIGFEPSYEEKVFHLFQRLHGRGSYAGTGIGLTICKRIVERHGGRIWAQSEPGKGATFYFSLPRS